MNNIKEYYRQLRFKKGGHLDSGCGGPGQPPCADIKQYEPQSFGSKAWDAVTNPMTAIESLVKTGRIPDNLDAAVRSGTAERNNLDMAVDVVNPLATARNIYNIPNDIRQGNYLAAAGSSLDVLPMGSVAKKLLNKKVLQSMPDIPTFTPSSKPEFKSEIDWNKWNKEITDNPKLLEEYSNIEESAKEAGAWMKNADGSDFIGTPEQFIQTNSKNFKKAFPEGYAKTYRGATMHNPELINKNVHKEFKSVFTADKELAKSYSASDGSLNTKFDYFNPETPQGHIVNNKIHELAGSKPKHNAFMAGTDWTSLDFKDIDEFGEHLTYNLKKQKEMLANNKLQGRKDPGLSKRVETLERYADELKTGKFSKSEDLKEFTDNFKGEQFSTDMLADYIDANDLPSFRLSDVADGGMGDVNISRHTEGNYLKSLRGNNGMFDMNNPNIYKTVIGGAAATGLGASASTEKNAKFRQGGNLNPVKAYYRQLRSKR